MLLTLSSESGKIIAQATLKNVDPSDALVSILGALKALPEVQTGRKKRSDAGKPKPRRTPASGTTTAAEPTPV